MAVTGVAAGSGGAPGREPQVSLGISFLFIWTFISLGEEGSREMNR
jgi:hypothetical protein